MKIECTVEELKEMLSKKETPAVGGTDASNCGCFVTGVIKQGE